MADMLKTSQEKRWLTAHAAACFVIFLYYMCWMVNFYLARSLFTTYFAAAAIVLIAFTLYFRRLADGWEMRLLFAYWLWFALTRILNGDTVLQENHMLVLELGVGFCFVPVGLGLDRRGRERFLDWLSAASGGFYFVLGLICLFAALSGHNLVNPITEGNIVNFFSQKTIRLAVMDQNPNVTAIWFSAPFFLMVYQFFHCRRWPWRIPIVLSAIVDFLCIGLTFSRNTMICVAVGVSMLVMLLVLRRIPGHKKGLRVAAVLLSAVIVIPLCYGAFGASTALLGNLSVRLQEEPTAQTESLPAQTEPSASSDAAVSAAPAETTPDNLFTDSRDFVKDAATLTKRTLIYRSALTAFRAEPLRLLRGSSAEHLMDYAAQTEGLQRRPPQHMHNFLLQVLMLTGVPGLLLVLAFCILLVLRMLRLFFAAPEEAGFADRTLILSVTCYLLYHMLETGIFTFLDIRGVTFFLLAGMVLGSARELPAKKHS